MLEGRTNDVDPGASVITEQSKELVLFVNDTELRRESYDFVSFIQYIKQAPFCFYSHLLIIISFSLNQGLHVKEILEIAVEQVQCGRMHPFTS